jgi:hypothetical protein
MGPLHPAPRSGPQTFAVHKNKKRKVFVGELSPQKQISRPKKRRSSRVSPIWQNFWGSKNL